MASLPNSNSVGGFRVFTVGGTDRGIIEITRLSDGAVIRQFCAAPVTASATAPQITSIVPNPAPIGATVDIYGTNLGDELTAVRFGDGFIGVSPTFQSSTRITCVVPSNATNTGVRVDTKNTGNSARFPFTVGTTTQQPSTPVVWRDFIYLDRAATFLNTDKTYYTPTGTDWGNNAVATIPLKVGDSGSGRFQYIAGQGSAGAIGLHGVKQRVQQPNMDFSIYVEPTGTLSVFYRTPGAERSVGVFITYPAKDKRWYTISRTNRVIYVQESPDETGDDSVKPYTIIYTFEHDPGGDLFWVFDINGGDASYHLLSPQYGYLQ